jgi:hypothetical protein
MENVLTIPAGSVEIQPGLWAFLNSFTVGGTTYSNYHLYSAEGYCFWEVQQPENYDAEGNLLPPTERMYAQYCITACTTIEELNANFVSVPVEEGFEIVSVPSNPPHETM